MSRCSDSEWSGHVPLRKLNSVVQIVRGWERHPFSLVRKKSPATVTLLISEGQIPDIDLKPAQQFQDLAVRETLGPLDLPAPPQRLGQQSGRAQVGPGQVENQPAPSICFDETGRRTPAPE